MLIASCGSGIRTRTGARQANSPTFAACGAPPRRARPAQPYRSSIPRAGIARWHVGRPHTDAGANARTDTTRSHTVASLKLVLGIVLLVLAARRWHHRSAPGAVPREPEWMGRLESLAPGQAAGPGAVLVAGNPESLISTMGAAAGLAQRGLSVGDGIVARVVFVVVVSLTIAGPVVYSRRGGVDAADALGRLTRWRAANNDTIMALLLLMFGIDLVAKGLVVWSSAEPATRDQARPGQEPLHGACARHPWVDGSRTGPPHPELGLIPAGFQAPTADGVREAGASSPTGGGDRGCSRRRALGVCRGDRRRPQADRRRGPQHAVVGRAASADSSSRCLGCANGGHGCGGARSSGPRPG